MVLAGEGVAAGFAGGAEGDGTVEVDVDGAWGSCSPIVFAMDFGGSHTFLLHL